MATDNLYTDIDSMLDVSSLIYVLAKLHRGTEHDKLRNKDFLDANYPKKSSEVVAWFKENSSLLSDETQRDFAQQGIQEILDRDEMDKASGDATLEVLDDKFAFKGTEAEIVYGITKNPDKKRITVVFRGSIDEKDWEQNWKSEEAVVKLSVDELKEGIPNPNGELLKGFETVSIHYGFYEYLFKLQQKEDEITKFREILAEVMKLLKANPGYSVYFTGHSLGAALATLAATAISLSDDVTLPVNLITFASPHVGRLEYTQGFAALEKAGRIQHLRITNDNDITPQILGVLGYKHTGVHMNLYRPSWWDKTMYTLSLTKTDGFWLWTNNMSISFTWLLGGRGMGMMHSLKEHADRLEPAKKELEKKTFDEIFQDPKL